MARYVVQENTQITPSTLLITLQLTDGAPLLFQPGQYAAIHGFRGHRPMPVRCFSIVSSPTQQDLLQFSMRIKGRYTHAIASLQPGAPVEAQGPYGGFVLNTGQNKKVVMLAGGIGITPFMSMIRFATVTQADTNMKLLYSAASQDDVPFAAELQDLGKQNANFTPTFVISNGPTDKFAGARTAEGRITSEVIESAVEDAYSDIETEYYICGPPPFMKGMSQLLRSKGVSRSRIRTEAFSQGPNRQTGKVRDWPFSMYALTALSLSAGSLAVMATDLIKSMPSTKELEISKKLTDAANARQKDLDSLVNSLNAEGDLNPESEAVIAAEAAANVQPTTVASTPATTTTTTRPTTSTAPTATAPAPAPAPTPAPAPVCTTTQSGVTTCR